MQSKTNKSVLKHKARCSPVWTGGVRRNVAKYDLCQVVVKRRGTVGRVTQDSIQDLKINGLKRELSDLKNLVNMLLVLVDPEDVKAALHLRDNDISNDELLEFSEDCTPPAELFGQE